MGLCVLHNVHALSVRFRVSTQLVQPLQLQTQQNDNTIALGTTKANAVAAKLSLAPTANIATHISMPQNKVVANCDQGACTGEKIILDHLHFSQRDINKQQRFQLHALEQVALGDKAGNYDGNAVVEISAA